MNNFSTNNINNNEPEQPETLEQKRNNVIEKLNNIIDLGIYIKKKKIDLDELNDKDFDILIYAIEHSNSVHLIKYILKETHYDTLNYSFFDNGVYKSFFVSIIDHHIDYKGYKIPLFSAIASGKFKIANLLLKKKANINYKINNSSGHYHNVDIINYLYYMSGYRDFLNPRSLKYILNNGFYLKNITTDLIKKMLTRNNNDGLLEIILKHYIYDNSFIVGLLSIYHNKKEMSTQQIQDIITKEKSKINIDESVYEMADEQENYDAIHILLDYDCSEQDILDDIIIEYEFLEKAIEYNKYHLVEKILNYPLFHSKDFNFENAIVEASKNSRLDILKLLLKHISILQEEEDGKKEEEGVVREKKITNIQNIINFENILAETSSYNNIYYTKDKKSEHIEIMKFLIETLFQCPFDTISQSLLDNTLSNSNYNTISNSYSISYIKEFSPRYLSLIINILIKIGNLDIIHSLLNHQELKFKININEKDKNEECPLMVAYTNHQIEIFKYLLDYGANYNIKNKNGIYLLTLALQNKNYLAIKYLLEKKIIIMEEDVVDVHPFLKLIQQNNLEAIKLLFENDNNNDDNNNNIINNNNFNNNDIKNIIKNDIDIKNINNTTLNFPNYGFTPIILAYLLNYQNLFQYLIKYFDINELDSNGFNILHYAILKEDLDTIMFLLSLGVEPNYYEQGYKRRRGNSALDISLYIQNRNIIKVLLMSSAVELNLPNWRKEIPLVTLIKLNNDNNNNNNNNNENNNNINNINNINNYYYSIEDKIKIMDQLIEKGSDVNFIDNSRNTPLIYAILENSLTEAEFLIKKGANVNYISSYGDSPLVHAIHKRNLSMVKLLIEYGADINFYIENKHYSLLMYAIDLEAIDIVKYLIDKNVEINFSNLNDFYEFLEILNHNNHSNNNSNSNNTTTTATTTTTTTTTTTNNNNKKEIFEYIVQHRGDLFTCNIIGEIISLNRFDLIKILIENQININIRDDQGNIPLSYGIKFNERLIVNYLIEHGANIYNVNHSGQTIYELCCECYDLNNDHSISIYNKIKRLIQKDDHNSKKN